MQKGRFYLMFPTKRRHCERPLSAKFIEMFIWKTASFIFFLVWLWHWIPHGLKNSSYSSTSRPPSVVRTSLSQRTSNKVRWKQAWFLNEQCTVPFRHVVHFLRRRRLTIHPPFISLWDPYGKKVSRTMVLQSHKRFQMCHQLSWRSVAIILVLSIL